MGILGRACICKRWNEINGHSFAVFQIRTVGRNTACFLILWSFEWQTKHVKHRGMTIFSGILVHDQWGTDRVCGASHLESPDCVLRVWVWKHRLSDLKLGNVHCSPFSPCSFTLSWFLSIEFYLSIYLFFWVSLALSPSVCLSPQSPKASLRPSRNFTKTTRPFVLFSLSLCHVHRSLFTSCYVCMYLFISFYLAY